MLAPIVVVAIRASQIELALPLHEQLTSFGDERFELRVGAGDDRDAARLLRDEGCEREQLVAFVSKRRRLLIPRAAQIDALFEIDGTSELLVERRIAGRYTLHAGARLIMAIGAGLSRRTALALPHYLAVWHRHHAGVRRIVILHR